jgi:hypothetical protein
MLRLRAVRRLAARLCALLVLSLLLPAANFAGWSPAGADTAGPALAVRAPDVPLAGLAPTSLRVEKQAEARRATSPRPAARARFLSVSMANTEAGTRQDRPRRIERSRPRRHLSPRDLHCPSPDDPDLPRLA